MFSKTQDPTGGVEKKLASLCRRRETVAEQGKQHRVCLSGSLPPSK